MAHGAGLRVELGTAPHRGLARAQRRRGLNRLARGEWRELPGTAELEYQQARRRPWQLDARRLFDLRGAPTPARIDGDILHAVEHVGDAAGHGRALCRVFPQHLAGPRIEGGESLLGRAFEHEVAGGDEDAAVAV